MKIKITSDSTCDLTQELLDRFHIATVPLYVIMDGVSYRDSVDITTEQIFATCGRRRAVLTSCRKRKRLHRVFHPVNCRIARALCM